MTAELDPQSPVHLAVDLGASSGRVIAGGMADGPSGGQQLVIREMHRFANHPVRVHDSLYWNVLSLWQNIQDGLTGAANEFDQVRSVGVDTWGVDFALIDRNDQMTGPVRCYRDPRTNGILDKAFDRVPREQIFQETGLQFMQINTLFQLFAATEAGETSLDAARSFLMMGDLFHWLLTGEKSIEVTNASTTQMLDPRTKKWCLDLLDGFGIPHSFLCEPTEPGTTLGKILPSVSKITGLVDVPVVVPATHDTASAVVAVPADGFAPARPDWCYISSGTWSLMGCELPAPKVTPLCGELNFTNEGGVRNSTRLLKNIGGLWVFQQIRQAMARRGHDVQWAEMAAQAADAKPFKLLIDPDHGDFLAPPDMIDAIEAFAAKTGQKKPESPATLYRAALEGLALRYRACLAMLEQLTDSEIKTIHIVGGGSQNELLCQMTADACNRPVVAGPAEATAIGNVVMQMLGTGQLNSIEEARVLIRDSFAAKRFEPSDASIWDAPAERFNQLATES
ncbi:rhamnulokinase [Crateriforma conspicua]|uniref:Rhamnulokinase n=1 Tax=Crateriforma conspicua TaxID=2527996 RepID=A0A5C6FX22_9PLAN|nr:rhamnulokinase family protein [Crateriforma conspicua]TWU67537.1 Rhamnulokinase [Crateriforma conspicua]